MVRPVIKIKRLSNNNWLICNEEGNLLWPCDSFIKVIEQIDHTMEYGAGYWEEYPIIKWG